MHFQSRAAFIEEFQLVMVVVGCYGNHFSSYHPRNIPFDPSRLCSRPTTHIYYVTLCTTASHEQIKKMIQTRALHKMRIAKFRDQKLRGSKGFISSWILIQLMMNYADNFHHFQLFLIITHLKVCSDVQIRMI